MNESIRGNFGHSPSFITKQKLICYFHLDYGTIESLPWFSFKYLSIFTIVFLHLLSHFCIQYWKQTHTPAILATRSASWPLVVFERLGLRCLLLPCAERMLRMWTSVALKKATMKGCLLWGPLRPTSPATHGFTLWPVGGDTEISPYIPFIYN